MSPNDNDSEEGVSIDTNLCVDMCAHEDRPPATYARACRLQRCSGVCVFRMWLLASLHYHSVRPVLLFRGFINNDKASG